MQLLNRLTLAGVWRWTKRILAAAGALALAVGVIAYVLLSRSLPDYGGVQAVSGPRAEIEILRDVRAVPHIYAKTEYDAYFALGFVHAQDRLWQMELRRRLAQGRVTELAGAIGRLAGAQEMLLQVDIMARTLDIYGHAQRSIPFQSADTMRALRAYADGVNAQLRRVDEQALGAGAPELLLLNATVEPWTPADSLAAFKLLGVGLSAPSFAEINRARFLIALGAERTEDLFPDAFGEAVLAPPAFGRRRSSLDGPVGALAAAVPPAPRDRAALTDADRAPRPRPTPLSGQAPLRSWAAMAADPEIVFGRETLAAFADGHRFAGASNAWAAAGFRTATRAPLLASDPHLPLTAPGIWYMARMEFGDGGVIGATIPGIPTILMGRNTDFAWGLTTLYADTADLYIEEINPENAEEYRTPDGWARFESREVKIPVGGGEAVTVQLRATRHGPVLPLSLEPVAQITPAGHAAALALVALRDEDRSLGAAIKLMRARSVRDAAELQYEVLAPPQMIVAADAREIAIFGVGQMPLRRSDNVTRGRLPAQGWVESNDWLGLAPISDLPRVIQPASGVVANANNKVVDASFPNHVGQDWPEPYRIQRLVKLLGNREFHTLSGFAAIQNDTVSEMARAVLPLLARDLWRNREAEEGLRRAVLDRLARWNGDMDAFLVEPLIFKAWARAATRRIAADDLGPLAADFDGVRPLFLERVLRDVDGAAGRWCDQLDSEEIESCADTVSLALDDALAELTEAYGDRVEGWRWGRAHRATHRHLPLGLVPGFASLTNIVQETPGSDHTVMRGQTPGRGSEPYANVHAGGYRALYDFADLDRSLFSISTGQSGHFLSRHYDDLSETWRLGEFSPLSLSRRDAEAAAVGDLRLIPAEDAP